MLRLSLVMMLASPALAGAQAAEPPLRDFVMPSGTDDDHPVPRAVPVPPVETRLPAPPGLAGAQPESDSAFALSCTAAEAALAEPASMPVAQPRCPGPPYTVLVEFP